MEVSGQGHVPARAVRNLLIGEHLKMPPAIIGAVIAGGATIGSALLGSSAAKKAAKAQTKATDAGIGEISRQFDLNRADLAPWRDAGGKAIGQGFAMLQPGYDYT